MKITNAARYDAAMDRIYDSGYALMAYATKAIRRNPKPELADSTESLANELAKLVEKYGITE